MYNRVPNSYDWICAPMAVKSYGFWGPETQSNFSLFASHLAIGGRGGGGGEGGEGGRGEGGVTGLSPF